MLDRGPKEKIVNDLNELTRRAEAAKQIEDLTARRVKKQIKELQDASEDLRTTARWMACDRSTVTRVEDIRKLGQSLQGLSKVMSTFIPLLEWVREPMNRVGEALSKVTPASFGKEETWEIVTDAVNNTGLALAKECQGGLNHSAIHEVWDMSKDMAELESIGPTAKIGQIHALANRIDHCVRHIKRVQESNVMQDAG
jgi:hypothetical protein